jgi:CHAT domain-containing protein
VGQADVLVALAEATRAAGSPARAQDYASRARDLGTRIGMPDVQWRAATALGRLAVDAGQPDAARARFTEAIEGIEALREKTTGNPRSLAGFLESRLDPYHERLTLAARSGRVDEAFADAERSKARALLDIVNDTGQATSPVALSADLRAQDLSLRSTLSSLNAELLVLAQAEKPDTARVALLTRRRADVRAQYDALLERTYAEHPELRIRRGAVTPATAGDARALAAARGVTIVEFSVTRRQVWAFVVSPTRVRARALAATPPQLASLVARVRTQIQNRDLRVAASARELHDAVIGPLAADLPAGRELIIVPDGFLWDVPFQALRAPSNRYLIEDHAISYAPSMTALLRVQRGGLEPPTAAGLLAVGNPTLPSPGGPQPRRITLMDGRLDPLPDAEAQVRQIAPLYASRTVLIGPDAKETTWKAEAPRHSVLHLATHGVLDDASPMHSFLLLSQAARDAGEDGVLEAWEVMDLPLRADVVVLSACETARGRVSSGEGVTGLMWSFFVAGAPTLVVSQWKVESSSSTAQMVAFHRAWRGGTTGVSKGRAVQQSMRALLETPEYAHPFYWAGYIVAGDAR